MKKVGYVLCFVCVAVMLMSCATLFHGERANLTKEERGGVDVGMLILTTLGFGLIGIIVDFATGCIYLPKREPTVPKPGSGSNLPKELRPYAISRNPLPISFPFTLKIDPSKMSSDDDNIVVEIRVVDSCGNFLARSSSVSVQSKSGITLIRVEGRNVSSVYEGNLELYVNNVCRSAWPVVFK